MVAAKVVLDYKESKGHWPDILICDPVCIHHISFELAIVADMHEDFEPIRLVHDRCLPAGITVPISLTEWIEFCTIAGGAEQVYEPHFHPEARN